MSIFAFSTENWSRPTDDVSKLMGLFAQYLEKEISSLAAAGVRLKMICDFAGFAPELQTRVHAAEKATLQNQAITLMVASNYRVLCDVVQAVKNWQVAHSEANVSQLIQAQLGQHT